MPRTHDQLRFDAVNVRALVLDDTVVARVNRPAAFDRYDRMGMHAGGDRRCRERLDERIGRIHVVQRGRNRN